MREPGRPQPSGDHLVLWYCLFWCAVSPASGDGRCCRRRTAIPGLRLSATAGSDRRGAADRLPEGRPAATVRLNVFPRVAPRPPHRPCPDCTESESPRETDTAALYSVITLPCILLLLCIPKNKYPFHAVCAGLLAS